MVCLGVRAAACMWESRDSCRSRFSPSTLWALGNQTQILGLDSRCPSLLSHLTGPKPESQPITKHLYQVHAHIHTVINKNMQMFTDLSFPFFSFIFLHFEAGASYAAQGRLLMCYSSASASRALGYRCVPPCPASLRFWKRNLLYQIQ